MFRRVFRELFIVHCAVAFCIIPLLSVPVKAEVAPALHGVRGSSVFFVAQADDSLSLSDRVGLKRYQTTKYVALKKEIQAAAGYDLQLDPQWNKMAQMCGGDHYSDDDCFTNVYFKPLADALKQVKTTPEGSQALRAKVKKVVVTYEKETACNSSGFENCTTLNNGVLTLNYTPQYQTYELDTRSKALVYFLEHHL